MRRIQPARPRLMEEVGGEQRRDAGRPGHPDDDLEATLDRARRGDRDALPRLRRVLDDRPGLWRQAADLAGHAERAWVGLIGGTDGLVTESLHLRLAEFKSTLAGPAPPTALEGLLIERVAVCWLAANFADISAAQGKDFSMKQAAFALDRQDRAHRRLLSAVAALTAVRKMLPRGGATPAAGGSQPGPGSRGPATTNPACPSTTRVAGCGWKTKGRRRASRAFRSTRYTARTGRGTTFPAGLGTRD